MADDRDRDGEFEGERSRKRSGSDPSGRSAPPSHSFRARISRASGKGSSSAGSFLSRVRREVAKQRAARGGKRASSTRGKSGRFNARGRGRVAYAKGIGPKPGWQIRGGVRCRARRVIVKAKVTKLRGSGSRAAYAHLRYLQRDGTGVERSRDDLGHVVEQERSGRLYDAWSDDVDDRGFLERTEASFEGRGDVHQFRLIVSPEDSVLCRSGDDQLRPFTRELMAQLEEDLGTRLDWVAVDHEDTSHPHSHVVIRGIIDDGKTLNIAGDYIGHGIRGRAEEIATRYLGLKTELDVRRDLTREVEQMKPTSLDRALVRHGGEDGIADLRPGVEVGTGWSGITRHHLIGRAKHLASLKLAAEVQRGRWALTDGLVQTLSEIDNMRSRQRAIRAAMKRHGIDRRVREHGVAEPEQPVVGRVLAKQLTGDELSGRVRLIVDGVDGYVHGLEVSGDTRAGEAREGAIVEIGPLKLRKVDQTIWNESSGTGEARRYDQHTQRIIIGADFRDRGLSEEKASAHAQVHVRRLEALARVGIVHRGRADGEWLIPEDYQEQVLKHDRATGRGAGLKLLSQHDLDAQLQSTGATWLDRAQTKLDPDSIHRSGFGAEVYEAIATRQRWLINRGLAERVEGGQVRYSKGFVATLEARDVSTTGQALASMAGKSWKPVERGDRIEGVYTGRVELMSGPYARIETQRSFSLVPWRDVLERSRGQRVIGRVLERSITWEIGRSRGLGL